MIDVTLNVPNDTLDVYDTITLLIDLSLTRERAAPIFERRSLHKQTAIRANIHGGLCENGRKIKFYEGKGGGGGEGFPLEDLT